MQVEPRTIRPAKIDKIISYLIKDRRRRRRRREEEVARET
jgi:hypothetical protein